MYGNYTMINMTITKSSLRSCIHMSRYNYVATVLINFKCMYVCGVDTWQIILYIAIYIYVAQ